MPAALLDDAIVEDSLFAMAYRKISTILNNNLDRQADARAAIEDDPRNWIVQELVQLSSLPSLAGDRLEARHLDLRPFVLTGERTRVFPGGLTRVAMRKGSLIVNSSQGGGSKDTWVLSGEGQR